MLKRIHSLLLLLMIVCSMALPEVVSAEKAPWTSSDAAVVMDADTGRILYEKNGDKREYPASMTKMMTCILALEDGKPETMVTVSHNAALTPYTEMHTGYELRLADLLEEMMLISDNGAAVAVAENIGGDTRTFAKMMNKKARELGANHTHFTNPNGLPDSNHYSTAKDMAKIAAYGLKDWTFRNIVSNQRDRIYLTAPIGKTIYGENTNELLGRYPGVYGIKTGWTRSAGGCLAAAAERDGVQLIVVVMHSRDGQSRFRDAASLLDYGFNLSK